MAKPKSAAACSGGCFTQQQIKVQYLAGYFNAHMLPKPSYRYVYVLWFVVIFVSLVLGLFQWLNIGERTYLGAVWKKWATKNRVYKVGKRVDIHGNPLAKPGSARSGTNQYRPGMLGGPAPPKPRKIFSFPSFGRLVLLFFFLAVPICLTLIGADFIGPNAGLFDLRESWPKRVPTSSIGLSRRDSLQTLKKRVLWGIGDYPAVTTVPPTITLPYRTWWTIGDRTGDITSALVPIIVIMALKQIPFALFSLRIFGGYAFDRLSFLHKWGGRIIWLFATAHLVTWTIQLNKDQRQEEPVWNFVFLWTKFRWGWVSYGFLTAMMALSVGPIRAHFYEFFYIAHVVTVIGFMVSAWMHHPPLGQWLYIPLAWWAADRLSRLLKIAWVNGLGFAGRKPQFAMTPSASMPAHSEQDLASMAYAESSRGHGTMHGSTSSHKYSSFSSHDVGHVHARSVPGALMSAADAYGPSSSTHEEFGVALDGQDPARGYPDGSHTSNVERRATQMSARYDPVHDLIYDYASRRGSDSVDYSVEDKGRHSAVSAHQRNARSGSATYVDNSSLGYSAQQPPHVFKSLKPRPAMSADVAAVIRPGYAFVQLLPGKTLRLTLRTPNKMSWKPGQWVYLNLPGVRWFESHPFTIASAHDADFPVSTEFTDVDEEKGLTQPTHKAKGEERTIVLLVRARKGFTSYLWQHVVKRRQQQIEAAADAQPGASLGGFESSLLPPLAIGKGTTGVHMRAIIDGPYGSSKRTDWGIHSSVVIVCGGSGVSFGISVLEHLCACIVGAERLGKRGKGGKHFKVQRIRFVWIVREFAHLQWIAAPLRRCIEMLSPEQLSVDLYVTHYNDQSNVMVQAPARGGSDFAPPSAPFSAGTQSSFLSVNDYPPTGASQQAFRFTEGPEQEEFDVSAYDLTHFDGEDQSAPTAAEMEMSKRIRSEGKLRRAQTRKATMKRKSGRGLKGLISKRSSTDGSKNSTTPEAKPAPLPQGPPSGIQEPRAGSRRRSLVEQDLGDRRDFMMYSHSRDNSLGLDVNGQGPGGRPPINYSRRSSSFSQASPTRPAFLDLPPPGGPYSGFGSQAPTPGSISPFMSPGPSGPPSPAMMPRSRRGSLPSIVPPYAQQDRRGSFRGSLSGANTPRTYDTQDWDAPSLALPSTDSYYVHSRPSSVVHLVNDAASRAAAISRPHNDDVPIDLDDDEDMDLRVIAELARPGHPKLDRIVREEVEGAQGRILVANCGPKSLDVVLRSIVSKQINLDRLKRGDLRGHVNVVSECFEWGG